MNWRLKRSKLAFIVVLVFIPLLWLGLVASLGLSEYLNLMHRAQAATDHINTLQQTIKAVQTQVTQNGTDSLPGQISILSQQLDAVGGDLTYVQNELDRYHPLLEFAKVVTPFRADLETVQYLVASGQNFVKAGQRALDVGNLALNSFNNIKSISLIGFDQNTGTANPDTVNSSSGGLIDPARLDQIQSGLQDVTQLVKQGIVSFNKIPYGQLNPNSTLGKAVEELRNQIPTLSSALDQANQGFAVAQKLLGFTEPATYLILLHDADELRADGGFSGNYALITLWHGKMVDFLFDNTYKPDDAAIANAPILAPEPYFQWWGSGSDLRFRWGLRDVGLTPDWPDVSRMAQQLVLQEQVAGGLTGVIAINPGFIQDVLVTTGPVQVVNLPDYNEMVDANNFSDRIHYHQALDQQNLGLSSLQRKKFTRDLAQAVLSKIKVLPKTKLTELGKDAVTALEQKDLLLYFSDPEAEKIIDSLNWSGRVGDGKHAANVGNANPSDYEFVVDTNEGGNKTNSPTVLNQWITDTVTLNADGSATHNATLTYNYYGNLPKYATYQPSLAHVAYNRFYIPRGSRLIERDGFEDTSGVVSQYGLDEWGQLVSVSPMQILKCNFGWQTPVFYGPTITGASGSYQLLVQRQPGAVFNYYIQVKPPEGMKITAINGISNGVINPDGTATLINGLLVRDMYVQLTLQKITG